MMNKVHIWGDSLTSVIMSSIGIDDTEEIGYLSNVYNDCWNGIYSEVTSLDSLHEKGILNGLSSIAEMDIPLSYIGRP